MWCLPRFDPEFNCIIDGTIMQELEITSVTYRDAIITAEIVASRG